ncbi:MAG: two-component system response regulator [Nitrospinae bacterium CG11_big_fil_rev_8_21_14_0_20_56_8]|nr:MAG: two-component system response regulator [Nitrospinae bacterium CG11_big_fil_rev_8_21_14_0_20_56_8]
MNEQNNDRLKQKILLVDDSELIWKILGEQVRSLGHIPLWAANGMSALAMCKKENPALILLDIMMPQMDGFEFLEYLKGNPALKKIPVIVVSGHDGTDRVVKGIELGALDYMPKPVNTHILAARINAALSARLLAEREERYKLDLEKYNLTLEDRVRERTRELNETKLEVIDRLARAAEYRDNETGLHVVRMSHFSHLLAIETGLDEKTCELILRASPMHDVGKIGIPDHILLKPGKLDPDEWTHMKEHARIGGEILSGGKSELIQMAETIARTHQEKWDGTGYPLGLREREIPLCGRIVAICDVFDALTSERPYKKAWPEVDALGLIEAQKGIHFDPDLVGAFKKIFPKVLEVKEKFSDSQLPRGNPLTAQPKRGHAVPGMIPDRKS